MPENSTKTGFLLINLGTPDAPDTASVRRYLREFLFDPYVITMNPVGRWLLLNLIILPTRPAKSAEAYRAIWTDEGSPLLVNMERLTQKVSDRLKDQGPVVLAMRYGSPSIPKGVQALHDQGVTRVVVLPLYPQYATSSTESSLARVREVNKKLASPMELIEVRDFFEDPRFLDGVIKRMKESFAGGKPDHILFSYHGLPESHLKVLDPSGHCLGSADCCAAMVPANRDCYRAQSYATTRALVKALGLAEDEYSVAFQSRLGREPWIKPYTDEVIPKIAARGVKHLGVVVPSFTADCLETLEEIGIRGKEQFIEEGGEELTLVPCNNAMDSWADGVAEIFLEYAESAKPALAQT